MLQPVKNIDEYKKIKQNLRERFEADRTGEQHLFIEQTKLLEPVIKSLISTQEHTVSAIRAQQPLVRPALTMPEAPRALEAATEEEPIKIDLDSGLDEIDVRNLQDMGFQLPSVVFKNIEEIEKTLAKIKTENRRIGQKLGKGSDVASEKKEVYISWKKTLETYRQNIQGLEGAKQFVGTGVDVIFYPSVEDLCLTLSKLDAAKQAGNTGLDSRITSVLDELLRTGAVTKNEYDSLHKIIFL